MSHIDPDLLALEAVESATLDDADRAHLQECELCRADLDAFLRAVRSARIGGPDRLEAPADRVWQAIAAEVGQDAATMPHPVSSTGPVRHRAPRRRRGRTIALLTSVAAGLAAVAIVIAVTLPRPVGLATATLDAFPAHPGARGTAELEREPDGTERVRVELAATLPADGFREVWLLTGDGTSLVSLGILEGRSGSFAVPAGVDTATYSVVDISQEPEDGDGRHSGDSIVRGTLARL